MTAPQTLLQMAGASPSPAPLSQAAVIVIDAQNEYVDGRLALPGVGESLEAIARLLTRARGTEAPVIHVRHIGRPGGAFDPEGRSGAFAPQAMPEPGEIIVGKGLPNAFAGTDLMEALTAINRKQLVVAGFMTHMCVSSTVRAALDHGFASTIVAAASGTRDLPAATGDGVMPAAQLHAASLAALADRFAVIVPGVDDVPD